MDERITKRCGKQNPFTVPEGYFDTLNERIMESVDKSERHTTVWLRWCLTAAAACVAGVLLFNTYTTDSIITSDEILSETDYFIDDETYQKEVLNYALVDNDDVYSYLAGVEY